MDSDDYVRAQYRSTENLEARISVWRTIDAARSPQDTALQALREVAPKSVLEVGSGNGSLATRIVNELHCRVIGLDASTAMTQASTAKGVVSIQGDVRSLPFRDATFDAVVAAWMLYHVSPLEQALSELSRVLSPGGTLVAITNGADHLRELWNIAGVERASLAFSAENGVELLRTRFSDVTKVEVSMVAQFVNARAAETYLRSVGQGDRVARLAGTIWPLEAHGATAVFVTKKDS